MGSARSTFCAGLTVSVAEGLETLDNWSLPMWHLQHLLLARVCDMCGVVSLLQDSFSTSWIHGSYCTWSVDLSVVNPQFWRGLIFNTGHLLRCSSVAPSLLTKSSPHSGHASVKYLCLSLPLRPKKSFSESSFFQLKRHTM